MQSLASMTVSDTACAALATIGAFVVARKVTKAASFVYKAFIRPQPNLVARYKKAGSWAIVTGGTSGVGLGMATELAAMGFDVIIIANAGLEEAAATVAAARAGTKVHTILFDFLAAGDAEYDGLFKQLDAFAVGVLVNNVGINYDGPEFFDLKSIAVDERLTAVNIAPQLRMTKYIIPRFKAARAGGIVNLASVLALVPAPLFAVYSGTKAFNRAFSDSIRGELYRYNVDVLTVTPGLVCSAMSQRTDPSFECVAAAAMARQALASLPDNTTTYGHRNHGMVWGAMRAMPAWFQHYMVYGGCVKERKVFAKRRAEAAAGDRASLEGKTK